MHSHRYQVLLADEPASLACHHRLRYQVYCLDKGYEEASAFPDGQEKDRFDIYSAHFVSCDRQTGEVVGALRMVMPHSPAFPCESVGDFDASALTGLERMRIAEISRLCLIKPEPQTPWLVASNGRMNQPMHPSMVALSLYRAAYRYSRERNVSHWLGFTSPAMRRLLGTENAHAVPVGKPLEHRGHRQTYLFNIQQIPTLDPHQPNGQPYISARSLINSPVASVA